MKRIALLVVTGLLLGATAAHATAGRSSHSAQTPATSTSRPRASPRRLRPHQAATIPPPTRPATTTASTTPPPTRQETTTGWTIPPPTMSVTTTAPARPGTRPAMTTGATAGPPTEAAVRPHGSSHDDGAATVTAALARTERPAGTLQSWPFPRMRRREPTPSLPLLYEQLRPALVRFAEGIVGDRADAEEAVQDAFLAASRAARLDDPRPWLYRVTRNAAVDVLRRRRRLVSLDAAGSPAGRGRAQSPRPGRAVGRASVAAATASTACPTSSARRCCCGSWPGSAIARSRGCSTSARQT